MTSRILTTALLLGALALAGCSEGTTFEDISPKAEKRLPPDLVQSMRSKGMATTAPIMVRIFKEESTLEVWKQKDSGRYDLAASYDICKWSGRLGPKFTEGDRQAPEGFYTVRPHQMNPLSSYHLSFNIGFPNAYDRVNGRSGQHLMVHGACSSSGCYSMTDEQVEQIYAFARDAFKGGQTEFQIQAFPFRMTAENMARYKDDPNYGFWTMLKEGYDHFEITKVPPQVDVCGKRYVFNRMPTDGGAFSAAATCPATTMPQSLEIAYRSYQKSYETAFASATGAWRKPVTPSPTIAGADEAVLVADWSRRRARGERVTRLPPSLANPEVLVAEVEAKRESLQQTVAVVPTPSPVESETAVAAASPTMPGAVVSGTASSGTGGPSVGSVLTSFLPFKRKPAAASAPEQPVAASLTVGDGEAVEAAASPNAAVQPAASVETQVEAVAEVQASAAVQTEQPAEPEPLAEAAPQKAPQAPPAGIRGKLRSLFGG